MNIMRPYQIVCWTTILILLATTDLSGKPIPGIPSNGLEADAGHAIAIPLLTTTAQPGLNFNAPPWTQAAGISGFFKLDTSQSAAMPTWVYIFYDKTSLWAAFRCEGRPGTQLKKKIAERDGFVWRDDSIEILIDPRHSHTNCFQIVVNCAGIVYDGENADKEWNADVGIQTRIDEKGWSAVIRLPFSAMKVDSPRPNEVWAINFCRTSSAPERSSWAPTGAEFRLPRDFGHIIFLPTDATPLRFRQIQPISMGKNTFDIDASVPFHCQIEGTDVQNRKVVTEKKDIATGLPLSWEIHDDRTRRLELNFQDDSNRLLACLRLPMESPEVLPRIRNLQKQFDLIHDSSDSFPPEPRQKAQDLLGQVETLFKEVTNIADNPGRHSAESWLQLQKLATDLEMRLDSAIAYAQTNVHSPNADFGVGLESPMKKVFIQDKPFEGAFGDRYDLHLARNEHEGMQVVAIPFHKNLKNVSVSVSPPRSKDNSKAFTNGKVQVFLVGYVDVADNPRYDADYHGWWPDPLLDFQLSCDAKAGQHIPFWVDVATAPETPAGQYEATITISADGCREVHVKLIVTVWDFQLPNGTHLPNAFTFNEPMVGGFYRGKWGHDLARKYHDLILEHRLNIDHLYRREPPDIELMKYGASKGMSAFNLGGAFRFGRKDKPAAELNRYINQLKKEGLFDLAYVYGFDEVKADKFEEIRNVFGAIHRAFPGLKTMTTAQDHSFGARTRLRDVVDIWVPTTDNYNLEEARKLRTEGKKMWWYICVCPDHPYANWFIEYPAIESRLLTGTMSYKFEADGFLYYLINGWQPNRRIIDKGPFTTWNPASYTEQKDPDDKERITASANGDGSLICPGPDGPLSTIRLENIRDGFEDYEYLYRLKELTTAVGKLPDSSRHKNWINNATNLLTVPDTIVNSCTVYTRDPVLLNDYRNRLAQIIMEGQNLVASEKRN